MHFSHNFFVFIALAFSASVCVAQNIPAKNIQKIIDEATRKKLPGVLVYVRSGAEEKVFTSGLADIEHQTTLSTDHLFALGSIGKTYLTVAVMKLVDAGVLVLDDPISKYLSAETINAIPNGKKITVRQLLANTAGLYNYEYHPALNQLYLSGHLKLDTLNHLNALKRYSFNDPATSEPGAEYHYSSTHFVLASMIVDRLVSEGHSVFLRKEVLARHRQTESYYRETPPSRLVNHYGDLSQDGLLENLTAQTIETTNWFAGDDGIYSSITESAHFMTSLLKGEIVSEKSVREMTTWNNDRKPDYGLGLMADRSFPYKMLIGHSGRGIGTTTDLYYFPKQDMTIAVYCNAGIRGSHPSFKKTYLKMRNRNIRKIFLL